MGFIKFDNGACLAIEFGWAANIEAEDAYFELMGTKAGARKHWYDKNVKIFGEANGTVIDSSPLLSSHNAGVTEHELNINHFVDCILHGTEPDFVPQQGVDMIKILSAIYKSAETGREVIL